jgi:3'(2'), 5'-bisphosphate nucleotidase
VNSPSVQLRNHLGIYMVHVDITEILKISNQAARLVMMIYEQQSLEIMKKMDHSVLTKADVESNTYICSSLEKLYPSIPIISEESIKQFDYEERKNWDYFFLVDPLDGTKEFIQRNGEFTINIALIKNDKPILGVVNAPALGLIYYAEKGKGAYKILNNEHIKLETHQPLEGVFRAVVSRSHHCEQTEMYLQKLNDDGKQVSVIASGSALKFGLIAEGAADIYPRFAPTMEWDTAAGHILVSEVGKQVKLTSLDQELRYNKISLINPSFIVEN